MVFQTNVCMRPLGTFLSSFSMFEPFSKALFGVMFWAQRWAQQPPDECHVLAHLDLRIYVSHLFHTLRFGLNNRYNCKDLSLFLWLYQMTLELQAQYAIPWCNPSAQRLEFDIRERSSGLVELRDPGEAGGTGLAALRLPHPPPSPPPVALLGLFKLRFQPSALRISAELRTSSLRCPAVPMALRALLPGLTPNQEVPSLSRIVHHSRVRVCVVGMSPKSRGLRTGRLFSHFWSECSEIQSTSALFLFFPPRCRFSNTLTGCTVCLKIEVKSGSLMAARSSGMILLFFFY